MISSRWPLASKLFVTGCALLAAALASIGLTLWVSWQLEGGAAAVNEAGRMRMQTYRLVLVLHQAAPRDGARRDAAEAMDASLELLRAGEPARPLLVPWNDDTRERFDELRQRWTALRRLWLDAAPQPAVAPPLAEVDAFVERIDGFVGAIEQQLSQRTAVLRGVQFALVALAIGATVASFYLGHLFVLEPLQRLKRAVARFGEHDFAARVEQPSADEFGDVGQAFNAMAAHLQALYAQLEAKVEEKTARLQVKRRRLAALYEVSAFIARADALQPLAEGFARLLRRIAQADAVVVRWSDEDNERYLMLASEGLPGAIGAGEQCLPTGGCHCGQPAGGAKSRVIPIVSAGNAGDEGALRCGAHGFRTLLSVPVRLHARVLGEIDLLFREPRDLVGEERSLYDTLASHLAARIEALRAVELQREAAVAGERNLLAQELHDSIAQSLAFLKIQVALTKKAWRQNDAASVERSLGELESGVQESYADVRELLLHFRTRTSSEDIVGALRQTLSKFELQAGVPAQLHSEGHGVPLPADVQIQVLHIVQEALSNVRKHAHASAVGVHVQQAPVWRFEVRDDGRGFDPQALRPASHVGLAIMRERAERIGATLKWRSDRSGTAVVLTLPPMAAAPSPVDESDAPARQPAGRLPAGASPQVTP